MACNGMQRIQSVQARLTKQTGAQTQPSSTRAVHCTVHCTALAQRLLVERLLKVWYVAAGMRDAAQDWTACTLAGIYRN